MQVNKISDNHQSFRGLHIDNVHKYHMANFVEPCLKDIEVLAQKADIFLHTRINPHNLSANLEYAVKPLKPKNESQNILRWATLATQDKNCALNILATQISNIIKNFEK